ncbi:MAG: hypothetical protein ABIR71_05485 [Chthoniobacterales bacterium]
MRRRSPKSDTPLTEKQHELARLEAKLRDDMQKLERMIADAPRVAEEVNRRQREELLARASEESSRLDVSMTLRDNRYSDRRSSGGGRRVSLRKERREGRIIFLVLVIALAGAVLWLVSNFRF